MPIIQAVERALRILELFDEQSPELKITEISQRMNLHKSTVHSLLKTLQKYGYIRQNEENGKYSLGMKFLERGYLAVDLLDLRSIARPHLARLSRETGQTVHLILQEGKEGVYIDKVEGEKAVIRYSRIGRRVPLHSSAGGKALIAFKKTDELREILRHYEYKTATPNTIRDEASLLEELERVRKRGYATDREENELGVHCYAVPVRGYNGEVMASVSISMLASRVTEEEAGRYVEQLRDTALHISRQAGYSEA